MLLACRQRKNIKSQKEADKTKNKYLKGKQDGVNSKCCLWISAKSPELGDAKKIPGGHFSFKLGIMASLNIITSIKK